MSFQFGCFVSHARDDGERLQTFIHDFTEALISELGAYLDPGQKVALDSELLSGGMRLDPAIGRYMCESACWILIYVPKYRRREWCRKEYRAMRVLEERRRRSLGSKLPDELTMIVPVLLSGDRRDLPLALQDENVFVEDFSSFMVGHERIVAHPDFQHRVRKMAEHIWRIWQIGEKSPNHSGNCDAFVLPSPDVADWGPECGGPPQGRPS